MNPWKGKRVLITGVCGTVGRKLLDQVLQYDPEMVIGIDNNESELFFTAEEYRETTHVNFYLCDIKERDLLNRYFEGVDIVIHTAARKHVILNERSPMEAIQTNIIGTQNIIDASLLAKVQRVLFTSSDKAVNPTNVMGTSKLMGERLMTAANAHQRDGGTVFASTRFGNVLGSNGSVIPLFKKQIERGGPVTLTDESMTRFVMTLDDAVSLVMKSVFMAKGGEVFVTKMPTVRIADLAHAMISALNTGREIPVKCIGSKPGEKLYEELMNEEEVRRTMELENYFVVIPAFRANYQKIDYNYDGLLKEGVDRVYRSDLEPCMNTNELEEYLLYNKLI